jgi:hypothetical protein
MAVAALVGACGNLKQMTLPASAPIPVHAWWSIPSDSTSAERYRELADAGFTSSMSPFPNADAVRKALDAAQDTGVKLFITCPELKSAPDSTVKRFMNHPALGGYHLTDEPNAKAFPELAEWVKRIQAIDPGHPCYINLFPNYATSQQLGNSTYRAHVDSFVTMVPVQMISYDHYPVTANGLRPEYYENLEIISSAARDAGKPFWAFALAVAHGPYPVPTAAELRLQVYSDLAYGAQGIQYFTYWTPTGTRWNFHDAPIDSAGARTAVYDRVKEVNAEIQKVAGVFMGSKIVSIGHTGTELPRGTKAFEPFPPFKAVETPNGGAVISRLEKDGATFLAVVNRDYKNYLNLNITLDSGARVGKVGKDGAVTPEKGDWIQTQVAPGDVSIFMVN